MIDGKKFFDHLVKNNIRTCDNIQKMMIIQLVVCIDYNYFKEHYKIIAIDLSKQQELDSNPKAIQQINFTGNPEQQAKTFFITKEVFDFSQGTVKVF